MQAIASSLLSAKRDGFEWYDFNPDTNTHTVVHHEPVEVDSPVPGRRMMALRATYGTVEATQPEVAWFTTHNKCDWHLFRHSWWSL